MIIWRWNNEKQGNFFIFDVKYFKCHVELIFFYYRDAELMREKQKKKEDEARAAATGKDK